MVYCAILAGGIGSRMGAELPKQYLMLSGKPVIVHTIEKFVSVDRIDKVLVLCPTDWIEYTKKIVKEYFDDTKKIAFLAGGDTRNDTIIEAIDYVKRENIVDECDILITHDAARPFVCNRIIEDNISCAEKYKACSTYISAVDTIAISEDGIVCDEVTDRKKMYQTQTPQTFGLLELENILKDLTDEQKEKYTDAVGAVIATGRKVYMVKGDHENIKITYPHDMIVAEAILRGKNTSYK